MDQRAEQNSDPNWQPPRGLAPWALEGNPPIGTPPTELDSTADPEQSVDDWIAENLMVEYPPETFYRALLLQLHRCNEFEQLSQSL